MAKGNKGGVTKDDERYGDNSQPKHENAYGYGENAPPASQGRRNSSNWQFESKGESGYPEPATPGGGMSFHERPSMQQDSHPDHGMPAPEYDGYEHK
jgi:hypothetical protein